MFWDALSKCRQYLLRWIASIPAPQDGTANEPSQKDALAEDPIARMKCYREGKLASSTNSDDAYRHQGNAARRHVDDGSSVLLHSPSSTFSSSSSDDCSSGGGSDGGSGGADC